VTALISGAGIAGLATGVALRQAGHEVEIFERTSGLVTLLPRQQWLGGAAPDGEGLARFVPGAVAAHT
jgi:2-polyprenyl-6-methoxyphenol hydroxylase-like FAD-dependent oxidoreductase